jgi:Protein of unknown function (DUF3828)
MRLAAALLVAAALPTWAWPAPRQVRAARNAAPAADDPAAPVREAYQLDRIFVAQGGHPPKSGHAAVPWDPPHRARLFTRRLAALLDTDDRYARVTGEGGTLDDDPLLDAQDFDLSVFKDLAVELVWREGDRAEVRARFTLGGAARDRRFAVLREAGRWAIDDVRTAGDEGSSLAAQLSEPHPCADGWDEPCRN